MKVLSTRGSSDVPFYSVAASAIGTAQFTPLFDLSGEAGSRGVAIRVSGRLVSPTGGGNVIARATVVDNGVVPSAGAAAGETLACRNIGTGGESDSPNLAATAARSFSAVYYMPYLAPIPGAAVSFRVSNTGTAYSAGTVFIDTVELLG